MKRKTALITGAGRGLGRELSLVFADNQYDLILSTLESDIDVKQFPFVDVEILKGDLSNYTILDRLTRLAEIKNIDVLIHCAAIHLGASFTESLVSDFEEIIDINLITPIALTKKIWPIFENKKEGIVIFINSLGGLYAGKDEMAYRVSKAGLKMFTDCLQYDATKINVDVFSVFLGAMKTDMMIDREDQDLLINPREVAKNIFNLCKHQQENLSLRTVSVTYARMKY